MNVHQSNLMRGMMLIGGELVPSEAGEWLESINPANEETLGHVPQATAADVNQAVDCGGGGASGLGRARAEGARQADQEARRRSCARRPTKSCASRSSIPATPSPKCAPTSPPPATRSISMPALPPRSKARPSRRARKNLHFTIREPYGVVGRIIPFNHPIKFAANALAAPLMAGNCVVLKPPETSPLSATMLGEICREVLPAGVVNIVTGTGMPSGDALARHPNVKRIAFTGSVPTGRAIQRAAAEGGIKHVTLELGGKNPLIAFPDMDPDKVAAIAVAGMNFAWQGQILRLDQPAAAARIALQAGAGARGRARRRAAARRSARRQVADGADQFQAPLRARGVDGAVGHFRRRQADDRRQAAAGQRFRARLLARADGVRRRRSATCASPRRRFSGRCSRCSRWKDEKEALALANSTEYGLTASIFTNDSRPRSAPRAR